MKREGRKREGKKEREKKKGLLGGFRIFEASN